MQKSNSDRGIKKERTLEMLLADNERFKQDGELLSKAKFYNNARKEPLLKIPIKQVMM